MKALEQAVVAPVALVNGLNAGGVVNVRDGRYLGTFDLQQLQSGGVFVAVSRRDSLVRADAGDE